MGEEGKGQVDGGQERLMGGIALIKNMQKELFSLARQIFFFKLAIPVVSSGLF